jgi:hypothetical protein
MHAEDVRKCPKGNCKYSGYIVEGYCAENIECEECKT